MVTRTHAHITQGHVPKCRVGDWWADLGGVVSVADRPTPTRDSNFLQPPPSFPSTLNAPQVSQESTRASSCFPGHLTIDSYSRRQRPAPPALARLNAYISSQNWRAAADWSPASPTQVRCGQTQDHGQTLLPLA